MSNFDDKFDIMPSEEVRDSDFADWLSKPEVKMLQRFADQGLADAFMVMVRSAYEAGVSIGAGHSAKTIVIKLLNVRAEHEAAKREAEEQQG